MNAHSKERRYDLDWLRLLGVLLLVPFHVALMFLNQHEPSAALRQ